jgi:hypothetical protein
MGAVMKRRRFGLVKAVAVALLALSAVVWRPQAASAYVHNWACADRWSTEACWDNAGILYNAWEYVRVDHIYGIQSNVPITGSCAKARTQAGNTRSGSGCSSSLLHYANIQGGLPKSRAYVYWTGGTNGPVDEIGGKAGT